MRSAPSGFGPWLVAILIACGLCACKSSGAADDAGVVGDADFVNCAAESRATPFPAGGGIQVTSRNGGYVVKALQNTFVDDKGKVLIVAPTKGIDSWTIETDRAATGTPIDGMSIAVHPYMPDHRHGTTAVGVTAAGAGTYTIYPLNLYMAGYWEITFDLTDVSAGDAPVTDSAMFPICVPD
jgi:hypothetical protein